MLIRVIIFSVGAIVSLLVLLVVPQNVDYDRYADEESDRESGGELERNNHDDLWTTQTRGHKMAVAVAGALAPDGEVEDLPEPLIPNEDQ